MGGTGASLCNVWVKDVEFLAELEDTLRPSSEIDCFIVCVAFAFFTWLAKSSPKNRLDSEWFCPKMVL